MSKRPFIIQDDSPNIIIVPTVSFCEPPLKKMKVVSSDQSCYQTPSISKKPEPLSESMSNDSVINTSGNSSNKTEESVPGMPSDNTAEGPRPSWASNYLLSIGDSHNPIKINLSPTRKKIEALKEKSSKKKITKSKAPQSKGTSQQKVNDDISCNTSKDKLTAKQISESSGCSHSKIDFMYNKNKVLCDKPLSKFNETKTTKLNLNNISIIDNVKYKETGSDEQHRDKIIAPSSSKYIVNPDKNKYITKTDIQINETRLHTLYKKKIASSTSKHIPTNYKFIRNTDQSTNRTDSDKRYRDKIVARCTSQYIPRPNKYKLTKYDRKTNECVKSKKDCSKFYCKTKINEEKIKYEHTFQFSNKNTLKSPQRTMKSKVLKKFSPIKKNDTSYYDLQTLKCKELYNNYKIPKISDKNKIQETKQADHNIHRLSAKDVFFKELGKDKCSTPVKSVVQIVGDSEQKVDTNFDLRSKLSRRNLNHYFTKLRNKSEPTDTATREKRDSLSITVPNDTDEDVKATGKQKLEDIKTLKKEAQDTPKFKKIKLVINVVCEKYVTSSSDTEDEESLGDTENNNVISNLDLSFLDDFNIDEIVESLCKKESCNLSLIESKENVSKELSFKYNADEINNNKDVNMTNTVEVPVCPIETEYERCTRDIKIDEGDSLSNETIISTNVPEAKINKISKESIKTSLGDIYEVLEPKKNERLPHDRNLVITNSINSETKQVPTRNSDEFTIKKQNNSIANTEKESSNKLTVSNISDIEVSGKYICKETKNTQGSDKVFTMLEARQTNKYINKTDVSRNDDQESLAVDNTVKIINFHNNSTDLVEENSCETISAIRMFLETHETYHLNKEFNVDKTNNSTKEISTLRKFSEIINANSNDIKTSHSICGSAASDSMKIFTNIKNLDIIKSNQTHGNKYDTNKDLVENKNDVQKVSNHNVEAISTWESLDNTKGIKNDKEKNKERLIGNISDITCDTYILKDDIDKIYTKVSNDIQDSSESNTINNIDDIDMQFPLHSKDEVEKEDTEIKSEAASDNLYYHSDLVIREQSLPKKIKNKSTYLTSNTDISEIIDLTNESDENSDALHDDESVNETTEKDQQFRNKNIINDHTKTTKDSLEPKTENSRQLVNDKLVIKSTKNIRELRLINSVQADEIIELKQESKIDNINNTGHCGSVTKTTKYDEEIKTENTIQLDDVTVIKTIELIQQFIFEDNKQADKNECITKSAKLKQPLKIESESKSKSKAGNDESLEKNTKHEHHTETSNNCQSSILSKTAVVLEDKSKTKSDVTEDSKDILGTMDLTNELEEYGQVFEAKCVVNGDEFVDKLIEKKHQLRNENITQDLTKTTQYNQELKEENSIQTVNDELVIQSTKNKLGLRVINSIQVDETRKLEQETNIENINHNANCEYVTKTTRYKKLETKTTIQLDDKPVNEIIEHNQESKLKNSNHADREEYDKGAKIKQQSTHESESKSNGKAGDDERPKKIADYKHQTETKKKCCQTSMLNKTIAVSEDKSKETSDITVDLKATDVHIAKRLEDRLQTYFNKKHTITSLLHFGAFSKIYECVSECGEKYALKMMDGNKIYRNSKVEYFMKELQRDVPKQNYHCVYLFNGFCFTKHWCILMELYPKNLKQALQENKKSFHINVIQNLSRQLVSAVNLLRHNNIIHTNIKPTHIMVNSANNQLKLCGFDEAQYKNSIPFSRNIGTVNYLAPEVILGHSAGFKMDVWSTALVMYEMATNIQLFPGTSDNDILYKQMWVCGPVPYQIIQQSKHKNEHFQGLTFMRQIIGRQFIPVPYHIIRKHDLVKKYVHLTYKNDWHSDMSYNQKQQDYAKLLFFCQLLQQMLVMDPQLRIPIEFVCANPFLLESNLNKS